MTYKEKRDLANATIGIVDFAQQYGFELKDCHNGKYKIMGEYKTKDHYLFDGNVNGNKDVFYQFNNDGKSGNILTFAMEYLGLELGQAVDEILKFSGNWQALENDKPFIPTPRPKKPEVSTRTFSNAPKVLILPEKAENTTAVFNYLTKDRGLDEDIVQKLIDKNYIMQFDKLIGNKQDVVVSNCAFISYDFDDKTKAMGCAVRGTPIVNPPSWLKKQTEFKGELSGSNKDFGFRLQGKNNKRIFVFESPIDAISHVTLCKLQNLSHTDTRLSLGGNEDRALINFLDKNKDVQEIIFCLDNDKDKEINIGQNQADKYCQKYQEQGFITSKQVPLGKDFNEDLQKSKKQPNNKMSVLSVLKEKQQEVSQTKDVTTKNKNKGER